MMRPAKAADILRKNINKIVIIKLNDKWYSIEKIICVHDNSYSCISYNNRLNQEYKTPISKEYCCAGIDYIFEANLSLTEVSNILDMLTNNYELGKTIIESYGKKRI